MEDLDIELWRQAILSSATPEEQQLCIAFYGHDYHIGEQECTLPFYDGNKLVQVPLHDIIYFKSCEKYCHVYCVRNQGVQKLMAFNGNLGYYERLLSGRGFFRCHKQYMIQYRHFVRRPRGSLRLELSYQQIVNLSKTKRNDFKVFQLTIGSHALAVLEFVFGWCMAMGME